MKNKPKIQIGARISMNTKAGLLMRAEMFDITIGDLIGNILYEYVEDLTAEKEKLLFGGKTELRRVLHSADIYSREILEYEKLSLPKKSKTVKKK